MADSSAKVADLEMVSGGDDNQAQQSGKKNKKVPLRKSATGLPDVGAEKLAGVKVGMGLPWKIFVGMHIPVIVMLIPALLIYYLGGSLEKVQSYEGKCLRLFETLGRDIGFLFLGGDVIATFMVVVNMFPWVAFKGNLKFDGNLNSNMYIYRMIGDNAVENHVVLDTEGTIGQMNRSNRSLHHMTEWAPAFLLNFLLAGIVFPVPAFILGVLYGMSRVMHQVGYSGQWGNHGMGFMLNMFAMWLLQALNLVVFAKSLMGDKMP